MKYLISTSIALEIVLFHCLPYTLHFCTKLTLFCRCLTHRRTYTDIYGMKISPKILCSFAREVSYIQRYEARSKACRCVCYVNDVSKNVGMYFSLNRTLISINLMVHPQFCFAPKELASPVLHFILHRSNSFKPYLKWLMISSKIILNCTINIFFKSKQYSIGIK